VAEQRVIHFRRRYLGGSETFIHTLVTHHRRWRPVVVTGKTVNEHLFPAPECVVLRGDEWPDDWLGRARWKIERVLRHRAVDASAAMDRTISAELLAFSRRDRAAVIHAHFAEDGLLAIEAHQDSGKPLVVTFYGRDIALAAFDPGERECLAPLVENGTMFLVEGPHMKKLALRAGVPEDRIRIQRIGIDLQRFGFRPPEPVPAGPIRVLLASRFAKKKGIPFGLRAFALARRQAPRLELTLIGDGPQIEEVDREIARLSLDEECLRRFPFLSHDDYARTVADTHIHLVPSVTASDGDSEGGAPTTLLEMQAMGKPIVATRHADIPYVVREGESALLADEKDVEGLAEALVRVATAPERWIEMGRAGRAQVEANHDVTKEIERLESLYDELTA